MSVKNSNTLMKHDSERRFPVFWPFCVSYLRSADVSARWAKQSEWHGLSATHRAMVLRRNLHRLHHQVSDVLFAYHQPPSTVSVFLLALHDGVFCMAVCDVQEENSCQNRFTVIFSRLLSDVVRYKIDDDKSAYIRDFMSKAFVTSLPQPPKAPIAAAVCRQLLTAKGGVIKRSTSGNNLSRSAGKTAGHMCQTFAHSSHRCDSGTSETHPSSEL